jgi:ribosomal protein S18 acetylase RimI-like enzyme
MSTITLRHATADNRSAVDFYRRGGFKTETRRMVKPL